MLVIGLNDLNVDERTSIARAYTDSAERWLRHLVDRTLEPSLGKTYITNGPWNKPLKEGIAQKISADPNKFSREVDATTFGQLTYMVCHPQHWADFNQALQHAYPNGPAEAKTFLQRIQDIRNDVAHIRPISVRQLEQAICYSNDLADSVKSYFIGVGMSEEFYVPKFISYVDSLGNSGLIEPSDSYYRAVDFSSPASKRLYPGDVLTVELEVDPSFDRDTYSVNWWLKTLPNGGGDGSKAVIPITTAHVGQRMELQFRLITKNDWHRSNGHDDVVDLYYRVPPVR